MAALSVEPTRAGAQSLLSLEAQADQFLALMASIRRSGRTLAGQPDQLSSLTNSQVDLVRLVLRQPGISVTQAAAALRLAPNTVSTLVRQLTERRMLLRRVDPSDRRVARLELTPRLGDQLAFYRDRRVAMLAGVMHRLPADEQLALQRGLAVLETVAEQLRRQEVAYG
jgi:DNA-binding MarR family transcriptional regulator